MPKQYNTLRSRLEAAKEGRIILTRKAARGVRTPGKARGSKYHGPEPIRGKRGRRIDEEQAYREGFMANERVVLIDERGKPAKAVAVVEVAVVVSAEPTPMQKAETFARTLILSGIEARPAIMRAAAAHNVPPRELALIVVGAGPGTNLQGDLPGVRP